MELVLKNVKKKHLALISELAKTLDIKIEETDNDSTYSPEFIAKIKQGDEDIKAGRTTRITLDDIWK